jgi:hypothetical protein
VGIVGAGRQMPEFRGLSGHNSCHVGQTFWVS